MCIKSSIGKKILMAVSGLFIVLFVIGHMAGNLKFFYPAADVPAIDEYAVFLRTIGTPLLPYGGFLWIFRGLLLLALIVHVSCAFSLTRANRERGGKYEFFVPQSSTLASRTMAYGGLIILLFVIYHILHLTTGHIHSSFVEGKVYDNIVTGFGHGYNVIFYTVALTAVMFHLYHGMWSAMQTLGLWGDVVPVKSKVLFRAVAVIVWLGFLAVPWSIYLG